jgi:hypothetical protein
MVFYWERVLKTLQEDHSIKITDEIVELADSDFSV